MDKKTLKDVRKSKEIQQ